MTTIKGRNNACRNFYSKLFRRKAFFEMSKGKKLIDILKENGFEFDLRIENDKKYLSKLASKWKKEFFEHSEALNIAYYKLDKETLDEEIKLLEDATDNDFLRDVKKK